MSASATMPGHFLLKSHFFTANMTSGYCNRQEVLIFGQIAMYNYLG